MKRTDRGRPGNRQEGRMKGADRRENEENRQEGGLGTDRREE